MYPPPHMTHMYPPPRMAQILKRTLCSDSMRKCARTLTFQRVLPSASKLFTFQSVFQARLEAGAEDHRGGAGERGDDEMWSVVGLRERRRGCVKNLATNSTLSLEQVRKIARESVSVSPDRQGGELVRV